jgi:phosphoglycerate dehydrogenase-like enzyme
MSDRKMRALITSEVTDEFLELLDVRNIQYELAGWGQSGTVLTENQIIESAQQCEIVIVELENINRKVIEALPGLQFVGVSRGTPVNVDLEYCDEKGISVVHTPGRNADSVADFCLAMMLNLTRKLIVSSKHLSTVGWTYDGKLPYLEFRGKEIRNLKIGLYGLGQIGERVAERLHNGFGAKTYFYDPFVKASAHATKVEKIDELFEISDIVSLHAPVVAETENSINRALLRKLGPEGILISSARAKLVIEEDLYSALTNGEIASAAIDVFWSEPIDADNKWVKLSNVICTPHIAGASLDVVANHCGMILEGLDKWLSSKTTRRLA